jgi:DNA-binding NarL/FixJ family response regulator
VSEIRVENSRKYAGKLVDSEGSSGDRANRSEDVLRHDRANLSVGTIPDRTAVLLDRHPLWLEAVELVLSRVDVEVVGKATATDAALALLEQHQPDIFVVEIKAAEETMEAFALPRVAAERAPDTKTIVLSENEERVFIEGTLQAGAVAYVVKSVHPDDLATTIRQVFEHSVYLPPTVSTNGVEAVARARERTPLTRRETEILQLTAEGYSNAQMAKMLWVTEQTIKFHLSNIYRKLDVANRTEASRWAQLHGMLFSAAPVGGAI